MTKDMLVQYCDMKQEVQDLHKTIQKLEDQINKIESDGAVYDTVTGGEGGIMHYKICGFPYPEYSRKKTLLYIRKANLQASEMELLELTNQVDDWINSIDNSRIRRIIRYKYLDDFTNLEIALRMGGKSTADSIRMEINRFLENE